ncbi:DMT family transporter [Phocaeicola barnesiae]|uniref:DMT family transporter n=1 Tax=Phocaeicola barnesiae TaxID=376804 RepID=UPI001F23598B|nr:DMT family transporter [Phocaeicola barnesiae]MCF2599249.1 DMT family transporter [Phocaeicola barnesiae]
MQLSLRNKETWFHLIAVLTVCIWGSTFIATKTLINQGLTPVEIFTYRFSLAYLCLLAFCHQKLMANTWRDEGLFLLAGLTGGSLYFISENSALEITMASNVSLIVCTTPVLTVLLSSFFFKEKLRKGFIAGSLVALSGVTLVVFNGSVFLKLNPLGDCLTLLAALSWAFYSLILRQMGNKYSTLFITRKVFFYGLITMILYLPFAPSSFHLERLCYPLVYGNLLFLGIVASMLCYLSWNACVRIIGAPRASNYLYINPLVAVWASHLFLSEPITPTALLGAGLIIGGVYIVEKF